MKRICLFVLLFGICLTELSIVTDAEGTNQLNQQVVTNTNPYEEEQLNESKVGVPEQEEKKKDFINQEPSPEQPPTNFLEKTPLSNTEMNFPTRLAGKDEFEVAVNISGKWNRANSVILVNNATYKDVLTVTPLAFKLDAPILFTKAGSLPEITRNEINRLKAKEVIIIGGTNSIATNVADELRDKEKLSVKRISGKDQIQIAENIALEVGISNTVVITYVDNYADILTIAPYAASKGVPILLTYRNNMRESTKKLIMNNNVQNTIIFGGDISKEMEKVLPSPKRIYNRNYDAVVNEIISTAGNKFEHFYVVSKDSLVEGLPGAILAAKNDGMLLLTRKTSLPQAVVRLIKKYNKPMTILGGTTVLNDNVVSSIIDNTPSNRPILYFVPHEDDEILSFSVNIRNELTNGRDVHLILISSGDDSGARDIINGISDDESTRIKGLKFWCTWHQHYHNPSLENYMHGHLTRKKFGIRRKEEFIRGSKALGVATDHIHANPIPSDVMSREKIQGRIRSYLKKYPNAEIRSMSWFDGQSFHALIGEILREMQRNGELKYYQVKYITSIYTDRFYPVKNPNETYKLVVKKNADLIYLNNAIYEYMRFEPRKGYYAIGYHSVPSQFDSLKKSPYTKFHY